MICTQASLPLRLFGNFGSKNPPAFLGLSFAQHLQATLLRHHEPSSPHVRDSHDRVVSTGSLGVVPQCKLDGCRMTEYTSSAKCGAMGKARMARTLIQYLTRSACILTSNGTPQFQISRNLELVKVIFKSILVVGAVSEWNFIHSKKRTMMFELTRRNAAEWHWWLHWLHLRTLCRDSSILPFARRPRFWSYPIQTEHQPAVKTKVGRRTSHLLKSVCTLKTFAIAKFYQNSHPPESASANLVASAPNLPQHQNDFLYSLTSFPDFPRSTWRATWCACSKAICL